MHMNGRGRPNRETHRKGEQAVKDFMRENLCHIALVQVEHEGEPFLQWMGNTGVKFSPRFHPNLLQLASSYPAESGLKVHE